MSPARPPEGANSLSEGQRRSPTGALTSRHPHLAPCSDEAARLLPWFVNGTLSRADAHRVAVHLAQCDACRADARELEQWQSLMRAPRAVEHAPQAGFRKLIARIDEHARAAAPNPSKHRERGLRRRFAGGPLRWLTAVVIVEGAALAVVVGVLATGWRAFDTAPRFQTLTTATPEGTHLRVVFVPTLMLAELHELLHAHRLVAIAGPSDAGLYTLALAPSAAGSRDAARGVLARLRTDPRVRFAELLEPEAGAR